MFWVQLSDSKFVVRFSCPNCKLARKNNSTGDYGAAFTKCFHNSSTIIPSTILPQANPDAPKNSSKRGRVVEELWKNRRMVNAGLKKAKQNKNLPITARQENNFPTLTS
jgi:hypothetical protein